MIKARKNTTEKGCWWSSLFNPLTLSPCVSRLHCGMKSSSHWLLTLLSWPFPDSSQNHGANENWCVHLDFYVTTTVLSDSVSWCKKPQYRNIRSWSKAVRVHCQVTLYFEVRENGCIRYPLTQHQANLKVTLLRQERTHLLRSSHLGSHCTFQWGETAAHATLSTNIGRTSKS